MTASPGDLLFGFHSDQGPRETNQDTVLSIELPDGSWLSAVADGMGGLANGELASKTALGALYRHLSEGSGLVPSMMEAAAAVYKEAGDQEMGTTLVAALFAGNTVEIANVGDSRAYHFDPLGLVQVTRDHTMGDDALRDGSATEGELASSPWAGALSRYLGADKEVEIDHFGPLEIHEGGWLLLCSDGLHRVFSMDEMEAILTEESDPEVAARRFVAEALGKDTQDNVSVTLTYRPGGTATSLPAGPSRTMTSSWDPERFLARPRRPGSRRTSRRPLAVRISFIVIPLLVGTAMAVWWWLSARAG